MGLLDKPKPNLNPLIWNSTTNLLHPEVKKEILDKLTTLIPKKLLKSVWFIGSSASLQYNKFSDIDINVVSQIPTGKENEAELMEWHHHFKYHNKKMDFLSGTAHPINYFIQPKIDVNWSNEVTSIYLIKDYETGEEDVWARPFIPYDKIRDPQKQFELNTPYAQLYAKVVRNKLKEFTSDLQDLTELKGKNLLAKLKEVESDIYDLINTYKDVDSGRKLQYGYGWGIPKVSDKNFIYKYLERENLLEFLSNLKDAFKLKK